MTDLFETARNIATGIGPARLRHLNRWQILAVVTGQLPKETPQVRVLVADEIERLLDAA